MNFQEAFWFTRHQQYHQNPQPTNLDLTTPRNPRSMNSHSLSFSLQDDADNDRFPDHDDQQSTTTTTTAINNNTRAQDYSHIAEREPMFEKPLTPSDVGKLNRLVIPKQHAEKYFPLNGSCGGDGESPGEKGLVLSFEDELGKTWRFRYSYWNSSQSYVLTKGWSRFVKEKKLDAGDVVLFDRNRLDLDKFFIGWRRRGVGGAGASTSIAANSSVVVQGGAVTAAPPCRSGWGTANMYYNAPPSHRQEGYPPLTHCIPVSSAYHQQQVAAGGGDYLHLRTGPAGVDNEKAPAAGTCGSKKNSRRRLRLFGVNLECHQDDVDCSAEPQASDASSLSSGGGGGGVTRGGSASASTSATTTTTTNYPTAAASYYHNNYSSSSYYDYVGYPS